MPKKANRWNLKLNQKCLEKFKNDNCILTQLHYQVFWTNAHLKQRAALSKWSPDDFILLKQYYRRRGQFCGDDECKSNQSPCSARFFQQIDSDIATTDWVSYLMFSIDSEGGNASSWGEAELSIKSSCFISANTLSTSFLVGRTLQI